MGDRRLDGGGSNEDDAIRAIHAALERGINLIDTTPVYSFGRSEEIVGKALAVGARRKRNDDPKFLSPRFERYLAAVERLDRFALSSADFFSRNC
jgi:predicted aldo/keto reductase-like oxidoreductase